MKRLLTYIKLKAGMRTLKIVSPESYDAVLYGTWLTWCKVNGFEPLRPWWRCRSNVLAEARRSRSLQPDVGGKDQP